MTCVHLICVIHGTMMFGDFLVLVMDPCYARSVTGSINFQLHSIII